MPLDEQDAKFEKALSRHLRAECPDAETLAAYHERMLAPEELIAWKKHIAGCGACQGILATLEQTEAIELEQNSDLIPAVSQVAAIRNVSSPWTDGAEIRKPVPAKVAQMAKRGTWRWAAPAGAIAAGLLVWIVVKEQPKTVYVPKMEPSVSAQRQAPSDAEPSAAKSSDKPSDEKLNHALEALPKNTEQSALTDKTQRQRAANEKDAFAAKREENQPAIAGLAKERDDLDARMQSKPESPSALTESGDVQLRGSVATNAEVAPAPPTSAAVPAPSEDKGARAAGAMAAPAKSASEAKKKGDLEMLRQQNANGNMVGGLKQEAYLAGDASTIRLVRSADGKTAWMISADGQIQRAGRDTAQWNPQQSGVKADLLAGSAPSESICWVVGRAGTILRTTDGGAHWEKIVPPMEIDWGSVRATDAKHAAISSMGNAVSYETTDGGAVWKLVTNP